MRAFSEFRQMQPPFWALVKYISETLGYTGRRQGVVRTYSIENGASRFSKWNCRVF